MMFVGHETVAFALAGGWARATGRDRSVAVTVGAVAAMCAALPDVDMVIGGVLAAQQLVAAVTGTTGVVTAWDGFWAVSNTIHRRVTHPPLVGVFGSVVVLATASVTRTLSAARSQGTDHSWATIASVVGLVGAVGVLTAITPTDAVARVTLAAYLLVLALAGGVAAKRTRLTGRELLAASLIALVTHPFGDVLLAAPPPLASPFDATVVSGRVVFAADSTLNLLAVTAVELAAVWSGVVVYARLTTRPLRRAVHPVALVGLAYVLAVVAVPRPTMVDAHWLGVTLVPVGALGLVEVRSADHSVFSVVTTGLTAITLGTLAYTVGYLVIG